MRPLRLLAALLGLAAASTGTRTTAGARSSGTSSRRTTPARSSDTRDARRWGRHVLLDVWHNGNSVLLHDLNGDGRLDVLSTAERGTNELRWWRNDGP